MCRERLQRFSCLVSVSFTWVFPAGLGLGKIRSLVRSYWGGGMALTLKVLYSLFFSQDMAFAVNLFELCPKTYQASRELHLALKITVSYPFKQQKFG